MLTMSWRKQLWMVGLGGLALLAWVLGGRGQQPQEGGAAEKPKEALKPLYVGEQTCAGCHSLAKPSDTKGPPPIVCRCNEAPIWEKEDKHKQAYTNLFKAGGRGDQMVKILKYSPKDVNKNCVTCHGVYIPEDQLAKLADENFKRDQSEGVTCVVCHGAYSNWVDPHGSAILDNRKKWRKLTRKEKEDWYGMTDLWDAGKRTQKCASCHIGNSEEGKVVTHAMYAAGHPPLPGLEVSTFSDVMPRHWQYLREKTEEAQKLLQYDPSELEVTKLVVVGGLVDLEAAMTLLADQAAQRAKESDPELRLLDLAQFDCYACHHELKRKGWRPERGFHGTPGRPQARPWPMALVKLGMLHAGEADAEVTKALQQMYKAFDAQPFGKPDDVAAAARGVAKWAGQLKDKLNAPSTKYDKAAALRILRHLRTLSQAELMDYDSARQLGWAFRVIYTEWLLPGKPDADFQTRWDALDAELKLSLPATQQKNLLEALPLNLEKIADYDPARFKKTFAALCEVLPKE